MKICKYRKYIIYLTIAYTATVCVLFPCLMSTKPIISNVELTLSIVVEVAMLLFLFALVFVTFFEKENP